MYIYETWNYLEARVLIIKKRNFRRRKNKLFCLRYSAAFDSVLIITINKHFISYYRGVNKHFIEVLFHLLQADRLVACRHSLPHPQVKKLALHIWSHAQALCQDSDVSRVHSHRCEHQPKACTVHINTIGPHFSCLVIMVVQLRQPC